MLLLLQVWIRRDRSVVWLALGALKINNIRSVTIDSTKVQKESRAYWAIKTTKKMLPSKIVYFSP